LTIFSTNRPPLGEAGFVLGVPLARIRTPGVWCAQIANHSEAHMSKPEIISAEICPYAQRSRIVLLEKGIEFDLTEIDLKNKPDWFDQVSPYSKVPVVRHDGRVISESAVINEYLEESFPETPLMPADAAGRADARFWIDFANVRFAPHIYKCMLAQDADGKALHKRRLEEALEFMEMEGLRKSGGPYWLGKNFSLVDATFFPHMSRFPALTHHRGVEIPQDYTGLRGWLDAMWARPSVKQTSKTETDYIKSWQKYADDSSTGTTARDMRES
jgi:glutathione S-transferase